MTDTIARGHAAALERDPFFILSHYRSGSTFLANQLVKHALIAIPPETNLITKLIDRFDRLRLNGPPDLEGACALMQSDAKFSDWHIDWAAMMLRLQNRFPVDLRDVVLDVCGRYAEAFFPEARLFGIKKGSYMLYYKQLKSMFPGAKFIGIIRDGRAVFNSGKHSIQSGTGKPFETDPLKSAGDWCDAVRLLRQIQRELPRDMLLISYEKLLHDVEGTVREICAFLQAAYDPRGNCSSGYFVAERYGSLHENINREALPARIAAWQTSLSPAEIAAFESVAAGDLQSLGYELLTGNPGYRQNA